MNEQSDRPKRSRRNRRDDAPKKSARKVDYRNLKNPFPPVGIFSEDRVQAIHNTALRVLEELGIKVLLPDARARFKSAGAIVDESTAMVRIGRDLVEEALSTAPRSINVRAGSSDRDLVLELGMLAIQTGAGSPNTTDLERGRRPATMEDYVELTKLTQSFDVFHMLNPLVEPQDIPMHIRHLDVTRSQLTLSDKVPFAFSRGTPQVNDVFDMIRIARGLDREEFEAEVRCYTIINTNSPRQIDIPMAQGLIDFAKAGQLSIVTPFCLAGAMAPVTVAGALTLSHAEALAAICLTQITQPGAPVCYGAFPSNVDMKSGAPAFGTPEHVKANLGAGQLARLVGLPWRCAAGCAANVNDAQAANETQMSAWGAMLAGCTVLIHGAGWLEGGLTVGFEKLITDLETMQILAELCIEVPADDNAIGYEALADVEPGGHFFATNHTMERYDTAFYEPVVADWNNFGTWTERGSLTANERATDVWKKTLNEFQAPPMDPAVVEEIDAFVVRRKEEGGAPPES